MKIAIISLAAIATIIFGVGVYADQNYVDKMEGSIAGFYLAFTLIYPEDAASRSIDAINDGTFVPSYMIPQICNSFDFFAKEGPSRCFNDEKLAKQAIPQLVLKMRKPNRKSDYIIKCLEQIPAHLPIRRGPRGTTPDDAHKVGLRLINIRNQLGGETPTEVYTTFLDNKITEFNNEINKFKAVWKIGKPYRPKNIFKSLLNIVIQIEKEFEIEPPPGIFQQPGSSQTA